jgi:hypothetical protein
MKFRPHRGGLDASMREMVDVDGRAGLIGHLRNTHPDLLMVVEHTEGVHTPHRPH